MVDRKKIISAVISLFGPIFDFRSFRVIWPCLWLFSRWFHGEHIELYLWLKFGPWTTSGSFGDCYL